MMCKFNTRLFSVLVSLVFIVTFHITLALPASRSLNTRRNFFLDDYDYDQNFDLHYDERQNGTENYRINLSGILVAPPTQVVSDDTDILGDFGISENDFLSFLDKLKNERANNNLSNAPNGDVSPSNEDISKLKPNESAGSSGKPNAGRDSTGNIRRPDQFLKLKLPFVSILKYLRRSTN